MHGIFANQWAAMMLMKLILLTLPMLYAAAVSATFLMQRQLQYFPSRADPVPEAVGLTGVTRQTLTSPDGETLVLWFARAPANRPTILYFQGNAGSIADRADRLAFYQAQGFGAAFLSYRGYGGSTGTISEAGLITDALAAYDWLIAQGIPATQIALVGESLGTGVAVQLAAQRPVGAVVLEAPYTAAVDVAARVYPWLPVRLLMKDQFRSTAYIGRITAPLLILHGTADTVIPFALGQSLFAAANDPKTFVPLESQGHESLYDPTTWAQETDFLSKVFPP